MSNKLFLIAVLFVSFISAFLVNLRPTTFTYAGYTYNEQANKEIAAAIVAKAEAMSTCNRLLSVSVSPNQSNRKLSKKELAIEAKHLAEIQKLVNEMGKWNSIIYIPK